MQRNKQVAMGRKKFNMDPKKVSREWSDSGQSIKVGSGTSSKLLLSGVNVRWLPSCS